MSRWGNLGLLLAGLGLLILAGVQVYQAAGPGWQPLA